MRQFLIVIGTFTLDLMLANNIIFVLFKFNDNFQMFIQSSTFCSSLLTSVHCSFKSYLEHIMLVSSANRIHLIMEDTLHSSFIYILNSFVP